MTYYDLPPEYYKRKPWRLSLWGRGNEWHEAHEMNKSPPAATSPWDEQVAELLALTPTPERFRHALKLALQVAFARGYVKGREIGYGEAATELTPTRHEMGG